MFISLFSSFKKNNQPQIVAVQEPHSLKIYYY